MRSIGFINEFDGNIVRKKFLDEQRISRFSPVSETEKKSIIDYLNNSEMVIGFTLALYDGDNYENYIGPHKFLSDGEWIWTGHFPYFLNKFNFTELDADFLQHLRSKDFKITFLSEDQRQKIRDFIVKEMFYKKR